MVAGEPSLSERLTTIHTEQPEGIRREVVAAIRAAVPNHGAMFVDCVTRDQQYYFTNACIAGDRDLVDTLHARNDTAGFRVPWLPSELDPGVVNRFVSIRAFYDDDYLLNLPVQQQLFLPLEVRDQLRAVMFDGDRLVGWIGLMRRGTDRDRFRSREVDRIRKIAPEVKTALIMAQLHQDEALEDGLCAVYTAEGAIEHASPAFGEWLTNDRREHVRNWVRGFDAGTDETPIQIVAGAEVRAVRMDGESGVRYMVNVDRAERFTLDRSHWLTPRQREVAELTVAGATNAEIARCLDISAETVKSHLKNIYRRLHVSNRTELGTVLST